MNDTVYEIVFQSNMITKLDEIYDYIARMLSAPITVKKAPLSSWHLPP